jgi:hypothetical protein
MRFVTAVFSMVFAFAASAQTLDATRYPNRLPDWLWQDDFRAPLLKEPDRREIMIEIMAADILQLQRKTEEADAKREAVAQRLSSAFSVRDLVRGAWIVEDDVGRRLAVHIDPTFPKEMVDVIRRAAAIFLHLALDEEVIEKALDHSIIDPAPMPAQFEMKDGEPVKDELGVKVLTAEYKLYARTISKPADLKTFKDHLSSALTTMDGIPPVLIISRYSGNEWWGRAYFSYFHRGIQRLAGLMPARGYAYIGLNTDRMTPQSANYNDARFWASKIAHEVLHNLGYWHPNYKDPAERDQHNVGKTRSFIVAYETFLFEKALKVFPNP